MVGEAVAFTGGMFIGKTSLLCNYIDRKKIIGYKPILFKHYYDVERHGEKLRTHSNQEYQQEVNIVKSTQEIYDILKKENIFNNKEKNLFGVEESQFFDNKIALLFKYCIEKNIDIGYTVLKHDFARRPFENVPSLLAVASRIIQSTGLCQYINEETKEICGRPTEWSQRFVIDEKTKARRVAHYNDPIVLVGAKNAYEARCGLHHVVLGIPSPEEEFKKAELSDIV